MNTSDTPCMSPLVLADKLIGLAKAADRAGYAQCAEQLLEAAFAMLDTHVSEHVRKAAQNIQEAKRLRSECRLN